MFEDDGVVVCLVGYSVCLILKQIKVKSEFSLKVKSFIRILHVLVELASFVIFLFSFHYSQQKLNRLSEASRQFVYLALFFSLRFGGLFFDGNECVWVWVTMTRWWNGRFLGNKMLFIVSGLAGLAIDLVHIGSTCCWWWWWRWRLVMCGAMYSVVGLCWWRWHNLNNKYLTFPL